MGTMFQKSWLPLRFEGGRIVGNDGTLLTSRKMTDALWDLFDRTERPMPIEFEREDVQYDDEPSDETESPTFAAYLADASIIGERVRVQVTETRLVSDAVKRIIHNEEGTTLFFENEYNLAGMTHIDMGYLVARDTQIEVL